MMKGCNVWSGWDCLNRRGLGEEEEGDRAGRDVAETKAGGSREEWKIGRGVPVWTQASPLDSFLFNRSVRVGFERGQGRGLDNAR